MRPYGGTAHAVSDCRGIARVAVNEIDTGIHTA